MTEKIPVNSKKEKRWQTQFPIDQVQLPAYQIHPDDWVSSKYHKDSICPLDNLGSNRPQDKLIPNGLKILFSQN